MEDAAASATAAAKFIVGKHIIHLTWECWRHAGNTSATCQNVAGFGSTCMLVLTQKITLMQEFCVRDHQQIVDTAVHTDTVVHTPRGWKYCMLTWRNHRLPSPTRINLEEL